MGVFGVCGDVGGDEGLLVMVYKVFEVVWVFNVILIGLVGCGFEFIVKCLFYFGVMCVLEDVWCLGFVGVMFVIVYEVL